MTERWHYLSSIPAIPGGLAGERAHAEAREREIMRSYTAGASPRGMRRCYCCGAASGELDLALCARCRRREAGYPA